MTLTIHKKIQLDFYDEWMILRFAWNCHSELELVSSLSLLAKKSTITRASMMHTYKLMHALSVSKQLRHLDALSAQTIRYRLSAWHLTEIYGHIYRLGNSIYLTLPNKISSMGKSDTKCTNERGALRLKCTTSSLDPPLNELCYRRMTLSRENCMARSCVTTDIVNFLCTSIYQEICHRVLVFEKLRFALTAEVVFLY
ncbi:Phosphoacetylglucosamine mutase [Trichinella spiralis]|uniref:Phosphoacetylglucosamine mutase n=1 Tax=Trichinella spiralis TaxID=6334 RepID=A0ABR3K5B3_TRISP